MQLITTVQPVQRASFHGIMVPVLPSDEYLAADPDGSLMAFPVQPKAGNHFWVAEGKPRRVGVVDLQGADWKTTLVEVDPIVE